jgi:hypothetical protein
MTMELTRYTYMQTLGRCASTDQEMEQIKHDFPYEHTKHMQPFQLVEAIHQGRIES